MKCLRNTTLKRNCCDKRGANPFGSECLGHQLLDKRSALDDTWVVLDDSFETATLIDATVDVLTAGSFLGYASAPLPFSLFEHAGTN